MRTDRAMLNGSSPRLRGTLCRRRIPGTALRFIPAPAGNALNCCVSTCATTVHPRACGERRTSSARAALASGSSPRPRGTHEETHELVVSGRFIPAPAGNARAWRKWAPTCAVHPRACGERLVLLSHRQRCDGSSPRLRGTRDNATYHYIANRFIPAPAGNACSHTVTSAMRSVHPRACGERLTSKHP